jgi:hypothetical protein
LVLSKAEVGTRVYIYVTYALPRSQRLRLIHTMEDPTEELPNYSPSPEHPRAGIRSLRREHRYALRDKNGRDWLSFQVKSRASNSKHTPLFLEGDTIRGEVRLDLIKAETVKGITISVSESRYRIPVASVRPSQLTRLSHQIRAGTTAVGQEEEVFLDKTETVWTPASSQEGKVVGAHTHAFSISIPRDAEISPAPKAPPKRFALPPAFTERASPAYIDYKLCVTVRRGGLRINDRCASLINVLQQALDVRPPVVVVCTG